MPVADALTLRGYTLELQAGDTVPAPQNPGAGGRAVNALYSITVAGALTAAGIEPGAYDGQTLRLSVTGGALTIPGTGIRGGNPVVVDPAGDRTLVWDSSLGRWSPDGAPGGGGDAPLLTFNNVGILSNNIFLRVGNTVLSTTRGAPVAPGATITGLRLRCIPGQAGGAPFDFVLYTDLGVEVARVQVQYDGESQDLPFSSPVAVPAGKNGNYALNVRVENFTNQGTRPRGVVLTVY